MPSTLRHGATLAWRGLVKTASSLEALIDVTLQPVIFLLLFVYVFGGQLGTSLGGHGAGGRGAYLTYVVPGILIITVASAALGTTTTRRSQPG